MPGFDHDGWDWFQAAEGPDSPETAKPLLRDQLAALAARCFRGRDGNRLIGYLRALTLERALGPAAPEAQLRHLEGQRQLVRYLEALVAEGRGVPASNFDSNHETEGESQ